MNADRNADFAKSLRIKLEGEFPDSEIFLRIENEIKFEDLDDDSQDRVLAKRVNFQGNDKMSFNQLIDDKVLANKIIDSENLLRLIENDLIQIGDEKPFGSTGFVKDYYIDREFNIQENPDNDNLDNISEMSLIQLRRKVTLVANNSGMGKSTTLTSVAEKIREISENTWILRIDLNDYASSKTSPYCLNKIKFNRHDSVECIKFLSRMVNRGKIDANNRIQRKLFVACLEKSDKSLKKPPIILLFDGFDEISPTYNEKTTTLIVSLNTTNVYQIWITTRPYEENHLKKELNSPIYYLQPLKKCEQKDFLNKFLNWHLNLMTVGNKKKLESEIM